jgi:Icc-related predicted phosphoesterase
MRLLVLSDQTVPFVHSQTVAERFADVDMVVSCGDLPADYLEYVVSTLDIPLLYVPGNHDPDDLDVPGGISVDGRLVRVNGFSIVGLGGSRRYKPKGRHQYTEAEMRWRMVPLLPKLMLARIRHGRGLDLFLTHAPPFGVHDASDYAHVGFAVFRGFLRYFRPRLMVHGHTHLNQNLKQTISRLHGCHIISVFQYRVVDLAELT